MFTSSVRLGARVFWGWKDCRVRQRILIPCFLFKILSGRDMHGRKMQDSYRVNCKEGKSLTKSLCHISPACPHLPCPVLVLEKANTNLSRESKFLPKFWPTLSPEKPWSVLTTPLFAWLLCFHLLRNLVLKKHHSSKTLLFKIVSVRMDIPFLPLSHSDTEAASIYNSDTEL